MTNGWRRPDGWLLMAAKGAPEAIAELCRLSPEVRSHAIADEHRPDGRGGHAHPGSGEGGTTASHQDSQHEIPFDFLGLVGLADPVRSNVPAAVRECRSAGIRVIMITGDYPATARAIAQQAGLDSGDLRTGTRSTGSAMRTGQACPDRLDICAHRSPIRNCASSSG